MNYKQNKIQEGIIKTLCYSDIFDFPLNAREIFKYFIGEISSDEQIYEELEKMRQNGRVGYYRGFYFLSGKKRLVNIRKGREKESIKKLKSAKKMIHLLSFIPTVQFIGISGSLSLANAKREDDIDIFVITSQNSLWITRYFVNSILTIFGSKRKRTDIYGIDKFCPNMFLTESSLKFEICDRNMFSAHEIAQVMPVLNKNHTYEKFITENLWVLKYLPNALGKYGFYKSEKKRFSPHKLLNKVSFALQHLYMRKRITSERVNIELARFHPKDKTEFVNLLHKAKYKNYIHFVKNSIKNQPQSKLFATHAVTPGY
jgi:D-beta-D-heptose 7-phosphate kinase/D-beta-D-heptose 1-phosphate adenosyltransferase